MRTAPGQPSGAPATAGSHESQPRRQALYRDGRFAEARAKYQRAKELDPDFFAPWLNLACTYAREDRFAEATEQAVALIRHAYVPGRAR